MDFAGAAVQCMVDIAIGLNQPALLVVFVLDPRALPTRLRDGLAHQRVPRVVEYAQQYVTL